MVEKYLNNRFYTLSLFPFLLGALTVFSYQPFNLTLINFFVLPILFYLIIFVKKNLKINIEKNLLEKIYFIWAHLLVLVFTLVEFIGYQIL